MTLEQKKMTRNRRKTATYVLFREKIMGREIFVFCVITFEPIKI